MLQIGLVGAPNSGKSTFFKAATLKDVKIANYPFTTIAPNEGLAHITTPCPCKEFKLACKNCVNGTRFVPFKIWDVAGLVPGAHLGRGRGNAFLTDVMQAEGLIHVLDGSGNTDSEGNQTKGFDPAKTIAMLEEELAYWMVNLFKKDQKKVAIGESITETIAHRFSGLGIRTNHITEALQKTQLDPNKKFFSDEELLMFMNTLRKIAKPVLVAANKTDLGIVVKGDAKQKMVNTTADFELALREAAKHELISYIPGEAAFKITGDLNENQKKALDRIQHYLNQYNTTGVQHALNAIVCDLLDMIVVYPVENESKFSDKKGNVLPDTKLLKKGSTPQDLAYAVHEDIGKKFIAAVDAKTKRNVASDYILKNGDIISIRAGK